MEKNFENTSPLTPTPQQFSAKTSATPRIWTDSFPDGMPKRKPTILSPGSTRVGLQIRPRVAADTGIRPQAEDMARTVVAKLAILPVARPIQHLSTQGVCSRF